MASEVKVRVAVAFDRDGNWYACGGSDQKPDDAVDLAIECVPGKANVTDISIAWVEAHVPVPEPVVVQGALSTPAAEGKENR